MKNALVKMTFAGLVLLLFMACSPSMGDEAGGEAEATEVAALPQQEINSVGEIPLPEGFHRVSADEGTFGTYLRSLPLKAPGAKVHLYNGSLKGNQQVHYRVIDIDVGERDLQQCADAVMRLRAEYLYQKKAYNDIAFNFTSGDKASFSRYAEGYRPRISGNNVQWVQNGSRGTGRESFRAYMDMVFNYAGTQSLSQELKPLKVEEMQIGDVFIQGGFPGHAVIVVDMAENPGTGEKLFMIAQSYMPAQEIHILKNLDNSTLSPWYSVKSAEPLKSPEWNFPSGSLKRF